MFAVEGSRPDANLVLLLRPWRTRGKHRYQKHRPLFDTALVATYIIPLEKAIMFQKTPILLGQYRPLDSFLHRLDARQALVHVHAAQQRLVEAGLELVGDEQDLVFVAFEGFPDVAALQIRIQGVAMLRETVGAGFQPPTGLRL